MGDTFVISGLVAKRAELAGILADLEKQAVQVRGDLLHLDATIRLFEPERDPAAIKPKQPHRKSLYFGFGEAAKLVREALRVATEPLSAEEIALPSMVAKGLDTSDNRIRADFVRRVHWTLKRLAVEGKVERVGSGYGVRWRMTQ